MDKGADKDGKAAPETEVSSLAVVNGDEVPRVENRGSISELARRFADHAPHLDLFELNGSLVYYDHRGERRPMTGREFRSWVEQKVFVVGGYDAHNGKPLRGSLSRADASDILASPVFLPSVRRIEGEEKVRLPVVREDGRLELLPWGYDAPTGIYTIPGGLEYPLDWDVAQGKAWFREWFGQFPFADERSEAVMVAALLVLFVRHLPGGSALRPGLLFEANQAGSGKSLCAKAACSIVLGYAPVGKRKAREEMDKEIEAHLRSKSPVIFLDNLYGSLKSATLDQLITSKVITFRAMGGHSIVTLRNDAPVMITGNDLEKNDDAFRRYLQCLIFEPADPQQRKFKRLLDDDVLSSDEWRRDALAALWSFVRCWNDKGRPAGETTLGSFEAFSWLMGGLVAACGFADPMQKPEENDGVSPEQADFRALVQGLYGDWMARKPKDPQYVFSYQDAARVARSLDLFGEMVGDYEHGKRATIKQDKLSAEEAAHAVDEGYLTQQELQRWSAFLKAKLGQEPSIEQGSGEKRKVRFGLRVAEKRRSTITMVLV